MLVKSFDLCEEWEYQKEAICTALRYLLDSEYANLRDLAFRNFSISMAPYGAQAVR